MSLGNVEYSLVLGEELFCFFDAKDGDGEKACDWVGCLN